jgi:methionyl-tRNA formyltransferase
MVFLGTPEDAVAPLRTLVAAGHEIALVVTRPDTRRGRGAELGASPVKAAALELGLPVTASLGDVASADAELGVVVAFGRIIPSALLERVPMVNVHFSLLPRWRGAAPVERAILEGDAETGVCLMAVEAGLDTGGVYACVATPIGEQESAASLRARLVVLACALLEEHLARGLAGLPPPRDQAGTPSYAEKIEPGELELHWEEPALRLRRVVRLGRAWTTFRGSRLRILEAAPADPLPADDGTALPTGSLLGCDVVAGGGSRVRLVTVQSAGRRPTAASEWLNGLHLVAGERLGT